MLSEKARKHIQLGVEYPYDECAPKDWCERAVQGVLADLGDRIGIDNELDSIDTEIRHEIVESLTDIVRTAFEDKDIEEGQ